MKSLKLSNEDRESLLTFTRYFAIKATLIIISSRSEHREPTQCGKKSEWFNINVPDNAGLFSALKKNISHKIKYGTPVCVELSLQTPEGDKMVLETWCICLLPQHSDSIPKVANTVYNQLTILLKSLISVTRVTPAFKLAQRQSVETYTLFFRLYESEPEIHNLGEGYKKVRIGQVCSPIGTFHLSVAYRVKMTISPTQPSCQDSSVLLKSDHFDADLTSKLNRNKGDDKIRRHGQRFMAAFADSSPPKTGQANAALKPGGMFWHPKIQQVQTDSDKNSSTPVSNPDSAVSLVLPEEVGRARTCSENSEDSISSEKSYPSENLSLVPKVFRQSCRQVNPLNYPFASTSMQGEVLFFIKQCKEAPRLGSLSEARSSVSDIMEQLEAYELKAKEFDELVKNLCASPDSDDY